jgi:LIVCS family branched-chain amino acid:cation transporter
MQGVLVMKERLDFKSNILIGSLLFGLFFGAGNLIFPVYMGQLAGPKTLEATIGFLMTGVGLPLLGVIASALSKSDSLFDMAKPVSKAYSVFFTCMLYLTIGPLFAIPRTASVAFEVGLNPFISKEYLKLGLFIFSLLFFVITLYFSLKPARILDWVGKYLTPIFLVLLSVLILATFLKPMGQASQYEAQGAYVQKAFFTGLLEGYNTMDALASLAFAIIIISNIEKLAIRDPKKKAIETAKSGLVCVMGMSFIYASLAYMGATSLGVVGRASNGGQVMSLVSEYYFGNTGKILLAAIVTVACLKTAIGLITSCSQMFSRLFPKSLSYNQYAAFFTIISFIIANFGLNKIIQLSIPVLMFLYPLAIVLIILSLLFPVLNKAEEVYKWTTALTIFAAFFDLCNALPDTIKKSSVINSLIKFARVYLPGFDFGFGWLIPALVGFIIGIVLWKVRGRSLEQ